MSGFEQFCLDHPHLTFVSYALLIWASRTILLKTLVTIGRSNFAEQSRITKRPPITNRQRERESIWKWGYFYDVIVILFFYFAFGLFSSMPFFNPAGFIYQMLFHATIVEFLYYWWHRVLHLEWYYKRMHQYHHKSINTEPTTAVSFEIYERLSYIILFSLAPVLTELVGQQSYVTLYLYLLGFDLMNEGGHINFEVLPSWLLNSPYKWVFYSPSYHSVHHTKFKKNFSLFMPWTDLLFGTAVYTVTSSLLEDHDDNTQQVLPTTNASSAHEKQQDVVTE